MSRVKNLSFTLLELLVCISIISVLAALLVPTLGQAKETAFKAKCMNNLKQIGMAIEFYKEDNGQFYPIPPPVPYTEYSNKQRLMTLLGSNYFNGAWGVFKCPSSKNTYSLGNRTNGLGGQMDYEMNSGIFGMAGGGTNWNNETVDIPTLAVVIYDWPGPNYYPPMNAVPDPLAYPQPHPSGGINAYFVDGHVAWITLQEADTWKEGQHPFYKWGRNP
jgi:prepilin-type N-terminal cleavage/methylation domain-containing protein/prepilin-type processing-associated H-X9-DG protein